MVTETKWAYHFYPTRIGGLDAINLIVLHSTESPNPAATGVANYFASSSAGGSTQWVIDDERKIRCVPDAATCWGAIGHNTVGLHYEQCGRASWSRAEWMTHVETIYATADQVADDIIKYEIPFVYPAPIVNGIRQGGIIQHKDCPGNNHTDCGDGYPIDVFLARVKMRLVAAGYVSKPKRRVRRGRVGVRVVRNGVVLHSSRGWRQCIGMLRWFARDDTTIRPGTYVNIMWQGHMWTNNTAHPASDKVTVTDSTRIMHVARSIVRRFDI